MGTDPKNSVLNKYNQVWDAKNVFVTDGACMTSASCVNPSLTYMALTARAVDFAVGELKKGKSLSKNLSKRAGTTKWVVPFLYLCAMLKSTLIKAATAAGTLIKERIDGKFSIEKKSGPNDLVTEVDKASECFDHEHYS